MGPAKLREGVWSSVARTLAVLALLFQVFLPQGLMIASQGDKAVITICTGHGPMQVQAPDDASSKKAPAGKTSSDTPCAFAGHAPPVPVPVAAPLAEPAPQLSAEASPRFASTPAPGRGLAAPPPPSRGPPVSLI